MRAFITAVRKQMTKSAASFLKRGNRDTHHWFSCSGLIAREVRMKRAGVLLAVLLPLFTPPAFGRVPELNVTAVCKARWADARMMLSSPDQSIADCVRDEESARQQLNALWASTPVPTRNRCKSDARSLGTMSYLDLLACLQIAADTNPSPKKVAQKQ